MTTVTLRTTAFRNFPGTVQNAERKGGVRVMEIPAHTVTQVIYQTRATVFHRDIQTPRRELKIRRAAEYF